MSHFYVIYFQFSVGGKEEKLEGNATLGSWVAIIELLI